MNVQEEIRTLLPADCKLGQTVHYYEEIDSTNRLAKELARDGAAGGTVILADRQTAGRGRLGKSFHSPAGGLYLSVILRPDLPFSDMMAVTACTASAVHEALADFGIITKIKWVNDLFLNDRKICGILCEGGFHPQNGLMEFLVVGIGLNLYPDAALPAELADIVTDIRTETGHNLSRNAVAASILTQLNVFMDGITERSFLPVYTKYSYTIGKQVIVSRTLSGNVSHETLGLAVGYSRDAGLIVRFSDGNEEIITTGTAVFADGQ